MSYILYWVKFWPKKKALDFHLAVVNSDLFDTHFSLVTLHWAVKI